MLTTDLLLRLPTMTEEERRLGLEIYRELATGEPVPTSRLAEAMDLATQEANELLSHPNLRCLTYTDKEGQIIGFGGLAVRPMPHRFNLERRRLYTWCAWDTLFIPIILRQTAEVESPVPGDSSVVRLRVGRDGVDSVEPRETVMSFLLPTAQTFQADALKAVASFCHYIFFFPDRQRAATWTARHPDTMVISLADAFELGRQMVATRWGL
jgi:alkylmercury lyase